MRVNLSRFKPSSENRRILRKGAGIDVKLVPRAQFDYIPERRIFFKTYADIKFGRDTMTFEPIHCSIRRSFLICWCSPTRNRARKSARLTLYVESRELAYYYYAFYDLNYYARNLGMFMMTSAVALFAERGFRHLYLGTCYSQNALYKTQFAGRGILHRLPLVRRSGRTQIHHQAGREGALPAPAGNRGISRRLLRRRFGEDHWS